MKNEGKIFEQSFQESLEKEGLYVFRVKDNPSSFGGQSQSVVRFTLNNPYDFIVYQYPYYYALELKSTKSNAFSFNIWDKKDSNYVKTAMIKKHQIEGLTKAIQYKGVISGFVFNFRNEDSTKQETYFLSINDFNDFIKDTNKKSINKLDVKKYKGTLIEQEIKKVKYNYNISKWLKYMENNNDRI